MTGAAPDAAVPALTARQPRAIHSALSVLEAVAELGPGTTAREVSVHLGLPRATTYRLLNLLVEDEYLVRTPDLSGFALGAKVAQLAASVLPSRVPTAALEIIAGARREIRGGVHVVAFDGLHVRIVDEDPDFPLSDPARIAREPRRTAIGRLMLVAQDPANDGTASGTDAEARTELTAIGAVRRLDPAPPGTACLALPIRDAAGGIAGAVVFSGPRHRVIEPAALVAQLTPIAGALGPYLT